MTEKNKSVERDREATEKRLIDTIGQMVAEQGFEKIGINAVAAQSGVSKILIYRYFGSVEGLMAAYIRRYDFWLNFAIEIPTKEELPNFVKAMFKSQIEQLRSNPTLRMLHRWELSCNNETIAKLRQQREERGFHIVETVSRLTGHPQSEMAVMASVLTASITYLVMLGEFCPVFNGIAIHEDAGWEQISAGIDALIDKVLQSDQIAMGNDFLKIISYAVKAPSGHNTQPWRFVLTENTISIKPNFEVALPVVDGDNRKLYISLGCATENLLIAATHFGYEAHVVQCDTTEIKVELTKSSHVVEESLFHQIERRQTNRSVYNGQKISNQQLAKLQSLSSDICFAEIGSPFADTLTEHIAKGNQIQINDKAFREELLSWMRFNRNQVSETGDGLSYKVFSNPALPEMMAKPIVRQFLKPATQNKGDRKKIASSSHLVLFTTTHNTVKEWIELGQLLQRFCLTATELGIASAFCNQPCEVVAVASELQKVLPINGEYPTLLLRIGYASPMPYSPRKKADEVIE